jgi:hypothetical protein
VQCVEFARRWWISQLDVFLLNVPRACDIWTRTYVKRLSDNARVALRMHANGESRERPAVHDFLIWKRTDEQPVGHIAIVSWPIPTCSIRPGRFPPAASAQALFPLAASARCGEL